MNLDAGNTDLNSHICFNALATLQNIKNVENSCSFCSSSDHSTYLCPVLSQGKHVKDTSIEDLSRSSVPHGLRVYENEVGPHIISVQKFAKGCRFGPLMAPKSYIPIENAKFPLTIFGTVNLDMDGMQMTTEFKDLFKIRHIHLDTRNEKLCNWMIHVDPAQYLNEQNLIAYEEDNEIFFAAIEDLDVGDILKVWYSPKYGECMKMPQLFESPYPISKNILSHGGGNIVSELQWLNNYSTYDNQAPNKTEILLPSIRTIIKPTSYICYENRSYESPLSQYSNISSSTNYMGSAFDYVNGMSSSPGPDSINIPSNNTLLNLDDSVSTTSQHTEAVNYDDEDAEQSLSASNENLTQDASSFPNSTQFEKKVYPCKLCDKKYSTMTNIYRHVRAQHKLFLCSLCMNMFDSHFELKEHIHKCPKSDEKKPQCIVCMQYFSNSWSLTRHLKIHVAAGECDGEIVKKLYDDKKLSKESKKLKDSIDLLDTDKNSQDSFAGDYINLASEPILVTELFVPDFSEIDVNATVPVIVNEVAEPLQSIPIEKIENSNTNVVMVIDKIPKEPEVFICIVCSKDFKSKSCLTKHLRSVHTVKILTGVKRPSSHNSHTKGTAKRSHLNESQASITHTGSPVNPMTAKALASKLNERNNLVKALKRAKEQQEAQHSTLNKVTTNNVPVPPLVSIQGTSSGADHRVIDSENVQQRKSTSNMNGDHLAISPLKNRNADDMNNKGHLFSKKSRSTTEGSPDDVKMATNSQGAVTEKLHGCDFCGKKFNKKYELKRHKTVHENVTYTCPYCSKVVKRKPSIIKHLKFQHKDFEHMWNNPKFIAELKKLKSANAIECFDQSENSNLDEKNDDSNTDGMSNGKFFLIEHLNGPQQNRNNIEIDVKDSTVTVVDYLNAKQSIDNNNYTTFIENNHISTTDLTNVFLSTNHLKAGDDNVIVSNQSIAVNSLNGLHHSIQSIGQSSEDDDTILIEHRGCSGAQMYVTNQKAPNANGTQANLTTIIDDCFFGEDALNCNVGLHSPFSSDNDVDGFTMTNGNNDCVMDKELLNKFHDRLEEIDEKIDNTDFKAIWNHMLDEENLNDDIDDNDETVTDSVDETTETNDYNNITVVK